MRAVQVVVDEGLARPWLVGRAPQIAYRIEKLGLRLQAGRDYEVINIDDDPRYRDLIGKSAILPLVGRRIPIVADEYSDPEKGTGAVKITPAHDFNDFEVGRRHKLEAISIFDKFAHLTDAVPEKYRGLERHGDRITFRYSVGTTEVTDSPSLESAGGATAFVRTLTIAPHRKPVALLAAELRLELRNKVGCPGTQPSDDGQVAVLGDLSAAASGLPAGLCAPHVSQDDSALSRLTRAGVRATLLQVRRLLTPNVDFGHTGVMERRLPHKARKARLPSTWTPDAEAWSRLATAADLN